MMSEPTHRVHGLDAANVAPDWPPLEPAEVADVLRRYPDAGALLDIQWHSPRPLSAAVLADTAAGRFFVKRHHCRVRSASTLMEEHRFMAHVRAAGMPVPQVLNDANGLSAVAVGDWVYEVHACADGADIYRDKQSWSPLDTPGHAHAAGRMLAALHDTAANYMDDPATPSQRGTHILVARSELIASPDIVATLRTQLPGRPGLADYLAQRDWPADLRRMTGTAHTALSQRLAQQPALWTHGDWHVSNLCWSALDPAARVTAVLDFGLCARTFALFDLATAIERNAIAWLELETGDAAVHAGIALALIEGYRSVRPLSEGDIHLLADLLPFVHIDFALSEVEYFHAVLGSRAMADVAYDTFLRGHAAWFGTPQGQSLLQAIRDNA
jgi:Ser/Thr protein kinase RdoA (MazF antagonist)